jgi:LDH2 family malate/lactate/ureidoglycolate dehydrogenase
MEQERTLQQTVTRHETLRLFFAEALRTSGVEEQEAFFVIEGLIQTSLRGVDSHGIRLFPHYVRAVNAGRINKRPQYTFNKTASSVGILDADHAFGHAAGARAMREAIALAKTHGISAVGVCNSTHFGAAAYYGLMAAEQDMIGISMTHADALMLASGGKRAFFGTNPICVCAPMDGEEPFCLDMATTIYNWNKVKMHRLANKPLPEGVAADAQGRVTTDPHQATCLLPVGDYKGFGLGMVVDIFCALLTGAPFGREIKAMFTTPIHEKRFLGQFYMVLDVAKFVEIRVFKARLKQYVDEIRREPRQDPQQALMVAGDPEKICYQKRLKAGIPLTPSEVEDFQKLRDEFKIKENFL